MVSVVRRVLFVMQVGSVETRFRRKCMAVLLALCPLVVATPGLTPPGAEEGTRAWVWQHLRDSGGGGVTEAVRVFEIAPGPVLSVLPVDVSDGNATPTGGDRRREQDSTVWERVATAADCYAFACETGVIKPDEMFLGDIPSGDSDDEGQDEQRSTSGKKRKPSGGRGGAGYGGVTATPPRILRSLAGLLERSGVFLRDFSFQSLVMGADGGGNAPEDHDKAPPLIIDDPGLLPTEQAAASLSRAVLLRRGFNLMASCLSKSARPAEMAALFVTMGLWTQDVHRVVVYSLAWPWAGGLLPRASDGAEVESCECQKLCVFVFSETEQQMSTTVPTPEG